MDDEEVKNGRLVLKRKQGEEIVIGNGAIIITVLGNDRYAIVCPKNISVHRGELFKKIKEERNA